MTTQIVKTFVNALLLFALTSLTVGGHSPQLHQLPSLTLVVNSTDDAIDVSPGDGVCETSTAGQCTLRAAIMEANTHPGPDSIAFADICPSCSRDIFRSSISGSSDDAALSGDLDITDNLTIVGKAARRTIIDGGGTAISDRVFHIDPTNAGIAVTILNVTIQNGHVAGDGGGVLIDGAAVVSMTHVTIDSNQASYGGGIYNRSYYAEATLTYAVLQRNRATQHVGGMANRGVATLTNVVVRDNIAGGDAGGFFNGGVAALTNVTLSGNVANGATGGVFAGGLALGGDTTLMNTTISGNTGDPGGIWNGGRSMLTDVTISDNTGGILNCDNCGAVITLTNTIVANSYFVLNFNCYGTITSAGHNLDSGNSCGFTSSGDITNADPLLGPLAHTVGRTPTHALLSSSPAIDAGSNSGCSSTDQRGVSRPQGVACDIGAYEVQTTSLIVNNIGDAVDMNPGDGVCKIAPDSDICTLRAAVIEANAHPGPDKITFSTDGLFSLSLVGANEDAAATGDLDITEDLTLVGNGISATIIDGGGVALQDRVFHIHQASAGTSVFMSGVTIQNGNADPAGEGGGILNGADSDIEPTRLILVEAAVISNTVEGMASACGGGIANNGDLELTGGVLAGNAASCGGGIRNSNTATALLNNAVISQNRANNLDGGGIFNALDATTILGESLVAGNTADNFYGGGISNYGIITLTMSTVSGNVAFTTGGGISNRGYLSLTNGTISGNHAKGSRGGGIWNGGTARLLNATITSNHAILYGSSIYNLPTYTITLKNTIVANSPYGGNCSGTITSSGHNLDSGNTCAFAASGDMTDTNPLLGPLIHSGGSTPIHTLLFGSPALEAGDNVGCPSVDQRGMARPQDSDGDGRAVCDVGAVEGATWLLYIPHIFRY